MNSNPIQKTSPHRFFPATGTQHVVASPSFPPIQKKSSSLRALEPFTIFFWHHHSISPCAIRMTLHTCTHPSRNFAATTLAEAHTSHFTVVGRHISFVFIKVS